MNFKINFPTEYQVKDLLNDNLDINVILDTEDVYFLCFFTTDNIINLMAQEIGTSSELYFWASDMVIVRDLSKETIKQAVNSIIESGQINQFTRIGNINSVFGKPPIYGEVLE
jgi:hypothetical protein